MRTGSPCYLLYASKNGISSDERYRYCTLPQECSIDFLTYTPYSLLPLQKRKTHSPAKTAVRRHPSKKSDATDREIQKCRYGGIFDRGEGNSYNIPDEYRKTYLGRGKHSRLFIQVAAGYITSGRTGESDYSDGELGMGGKWIDNIIRQGGEDAGSSEDDGRGDSGGEIARDIRRRENDIGDTSIVELKAAVDLGHYGV